MQTYGDLQAQVEHRLARNDLSAHVAGWVALAEKAVVARLRVREMEAVGTIQPINGVATPPEGFLGVGEIRPSDRLTTELEYASPKMLMQYRNRDLGGDAFWSNIGGQIYIAPAPKTSVWGLADGSGFWGLADGSAAWGTVVDYWMRYFSAPRALSPETETNALFPRYSDLYFYATLREAFSFVRNFDLADKYSFEVREMIDEYNARWLSEREGEGSLQIRAPFVV